MTQQQILSLGNWMWARIYTDSGCRREYLEGFCRRPKPSLSTEKSLVDLYESFYVQHRHN